MSWKQHVRNLHHSCIVYYLHYDNSTPPHIFKLWPPTPVSLGEDNFKFQWGVRPTQANVVTLRGNPTLGGLDTLGEVTNSLPLHNLGNWALGLGRGYRE